jgi:hypothetical protein
VPGTRPRHERTRASLDPAWVYQPPQTKPGLGWVRSLVLIILGATIGYGAFLGWVGYLSSSPDDPPAKWVTPECARSDDGGWVLPSTSLTGVMTLERQQVGLPLMTMQCYVSTVSLQPSQRTFARWMQYGELGSTMRLVMRASFDFREVPGMNEDGSIDAPYDRMEPFITPNIIHHGNPGSPGLTRVR